MEKYILTQSQKLIYDMDSYCGDAISNIAASILMDGQVNEVSFRQTICEIFSLNDALRTQIYFENDKIIQTYRNNYIPELKFESFESIHEFKTWAQHESQLRLDIFGNLCEIKGILVGDKFGVYIKIHHIISDAWSLSILLKQFVEIYTSFCRGNEHTVSAGSYRDHIVDVHKYNLSKKREKDKAYWSSIVLKNNDLHEISNKVAKSLRSQRVKFSMPKFISNSINSYCETHSVTAFAFLLTAFSAYLKNRYGNENFYIGTSVLNRNGLLDQETVGMFVNTAPILVDYEFDDTFDEAAHKMSRNIFGAFRHQRYSYSEILEDLYVEYNVENRLYDVLFNFQNINLKCDASDIEWYHNGFQTETLQIHVRENQGTYEVIFDFQVEKLCEWEIEHLYNHLLQFVENALAASNKKIGHISFITTYDTQIETNNTCFVNVSEEDTFLCRFEQLVKSQPNAIALIHKNEDLTYKELDMRSSDLALLLNTRSAKADSKVLLLLGRNFNMVVGLLSALKTGMTYIPVDISYPTARIQKIIDSCDPEFVLVDNADTVSSLNIKGNVINVKNVNVLDDSSATTNHVKKSADKNNLMYIIYTSGTTGDPKGVMLERRTFDNLLKWEIEQMGNHTFGKVAFSTTISFDVASQEILTTLYAGGTGYIIEDDVKKDSKLFANYICKEHIETLFTTPSYFDVLTSFKDNIDEISGCLKNVILAGEAFYLNENVLSSKYFSSCNFYNHYGPAETHVVTSEIVTLFEAKEYSTIGRPIYNTKISIVSNGQLCGVGMPGEIVVSGECVGRGYFKNEQLTQGRFFFDETGRSYKTGDFARWLPDGRIEYIGRKDSLVKIRGVRVEVKEIENVIKSYPGINDVFVKVSTINHNNYLFAYFLSNENIDIDNLLSYIKVHLPIQMVPTGIMKIDEFPLTPNGKVNMRALPNIEFKSRREYVPPRTELEISICSLYSDVLNLPQVGMLDDFFELGGHSLKATLLVNRIEELVNRRISVKELFEHSRVKELCEFLNEIRNGHTLYASINEAEQKEYYEASFAQCRLYAMDQIDETGVAYNMPAAFRIHGNFDLNKANYAFNRIVQRHGILRTRFDMKDGVLVQIIEDKADALVDYCDFSDKEDFVAEKAILDFVRPFSLTDGSLIRVTVVKVSEIDHIILFDIHHIIADGVSLQLIIKEFNDLYSGKELGDIKVQYKDYSEWQHTLDMSKQEKFWLSQFEGEIPVLNLPLDYNRPLTQKFEGACERRIISDELSQKINSFCRDKKITPYMLFLSSAMIMLSKYSMQDDIIVGSTTSGRTHKDTEYMLGMFVNTVALRGFPKSDKTCVDFLNEIHQLCLKLYENQDYPFEKLLKQLKLERTPSRNPLFDVMFNFQNTGDSVLQIGGATIESLPLPTAAKFDLAINVENISDVFTINFDYSTSLFTEITMSVMIEHYIGIIKAVINNPDNTIGSISYLSEEERGKLVGEFNMTDNDFAETTFCDLFEEQVQKYPQNTAVKYQDIDLSYDELNKRANYIAQQLIDAGVNVGDFIAILVSRTVETVVGILGIIKSGAAYVPVDPQYPENRINYIIEDCAPKFILGGKEELNRASSFAIPKITIEDVSNKDAVLDLYSKVKINSNDLLYVIYTSGTTGKPKGTLIENIGVINLREYFVKCQNVSSDDMVMQFASFAFDASVSEMSMSLLNGATMCIVPDQVRHDPRDLSEYCNQNGVTIGIFPPQFLSQVEDLHFRTIITAGSATSQDIVKANNINNVYSNDYGPTEVTVCATYWKNEPGMVFPHRIPIGRPINNKKVYILNGDELCGINMLGELCVAGIGLARGYLHQDELTAKKFTNNPFGKGRLYHTGDLARVLPDGNIEFWGRIDDQVKIRGYRVELDEVENAVRISDCVCDAAVITSKDLYNNDQLLAFVVLNLDGSIDQLRTDLRKNLPDYMIPSRIIQIDEIPINKNGKVDKSVLLDYAKNCSIDYVEATYVEATTEKEHIVSQIFCEILGQHQISIDANFFEMGGDSIKAIRTAMRLKESGYNISVQDIMQYGTVREISKVLSNAIFTNVYEQGDVIGEIKISPIHKNFLEWNMKNPNKFVQSILVRSTERLVDSAILTALDRLTTYHDVFGAVLKDDMLFVKDSNDLKRYVYREFAYSSNYDSAVASNELVSILDCMDICKGPLLYVIKLSFLDSDYLLFCGHHLIVDGVSWNIIMSDFIALYESEIKGITYELPMKTASYKYWVDSLVEYSTTESVQAEARYWADTVRLIREQDALFNKYNDSQVREYLTIKLSSETTTDLLKNAVKTYNTDARDLLVAAFILSAFPDFQRVSIPILFEGHGRENLHKPIDITRTVGWFTSSYPIVFSREFDIEKTIVEVKERIRRVPRNGIGFGVLKTYTDVFGDKVQLPRISFNYLGELDTGMSNEKYELLDSPVIHQDDVTISGNYLAINCYVLHGCLYIDVDYDKSMIEGSAFENAISHYVETIKMVVEYCVDVDQPVKTSSDFGLDLSSEQLDEILDIFS